MKRNLRAQLNLEALERRDAPATLVNSTRVSYQDIDGDNVTVTLSKPLLDAGNVNEVFIFNTGSVDGSNATKQQLRTLDITKLGEVAKGVNITTVATVSKLTGGDGFAALGQIDAAGIDLGTVRIDGDLGRILAGDADTKTTGVAGLFVHSMGRFGTATGAANIQSVIQGKLSTFRAKTDMAGFIDVQGGVDGTIGSIVIGGSMVGSAVANSGRIRSSGDMGFAGIKGSLIGGNGANSGQLFSSNRLVGVRIGGSVLGAGGNNSGTIISNQNMGTATIMGNIVGGLGAFAGEVRSGGALAGVRMGGSLIGGSAMIGGNVGSGRIQAVGPAGAIVIIGDIIGGTATGSNLLQQSGFVRAQRIASITVGGSLHAGIDETTDLFSDNGSIRVDDDIGRLIIRGNIVGNPTHPAIISARGQANPQGTTDLAIGKLTVAGRVEFGQILAGVQVNGVAVNADAQIGSVYVGGDWIASNLVAGAVAGADGKFGTADDAKMSGASVKDEVGINSRIASVTIGGQVLGNGQRIGSLRHRRRADRRREDWRHAAGANSRHRQRRHPRRHHWRLSHQ
jgi:hypothetical protein